MDWFTDLPVWLRYVAALALLGLAAGLQLATNTIYVWIYAVGVAMLLAALIFRDGPAWSQGREFRPTTRTRDFFPHRRVPSI